MKKLTANVTAKPDHVEIYVDGYLSADAADRLDEPFNQIGDANKILLVFDEKCFINSSGFAVLFDLILPARDLGKEFRIVHPAPHFRKVFDIVGLSSDVGVFGNEREAIAGF